MKKIFYFVALAVAVGVVGLQLWLTRLSLLQRERLTDRGPAAAVAAVPAGEAFGRYATVPPFHFTERSGKPVSLDDLKGKVWLANFLYTTCPSTCPMLANRLADLQKAALAEGSGDEVRLVSFSVDPEHDTPEVLREYADALKADPRWLFLTGEKTAIETLARKGFLLGFTQEPGTDGEIGHSTKIALVDRNGVVRRFYDGVGENDEAPRILRDLQKLLQERETQRKQKETRP